MKDKAERTVIAIERVTKRYGALTAVDAVSLDLAEGEFFALLGPSGCGKTTLLRAVAGFVRPDEGRVLLDGRDITPLRPNKRPINMMFQSYALFPHMSVAANVAYGLEVEGVDRRETHRRVGEILAMTHLSDVASRKPDQLSGGQRQRVALARALVKRPRVLLLDEPLAALDKKLREQMQLELKRMQEEVGVTFVVVTHDQEEALVMADRMAVLRDGVVQQVGAPRTLYERPANRFVAGFIGKMNVFRGEAADGGLRVSGRLIRGDGEIAPGARPVAAVRPERVRLVDAPPADGDGADNALPGRILDIAYHGQDMNVRLSVAAAEDPVIVRLTADAAEAGDWSAGREVWCCWRREHTRLLADG